MEGFYAEKLDNGDYETKRASITYQRAALRLDIDLSKPLNEEMRRELEEEVDFILDEY